MAGNPYPQPSPDTDVPVPAPGWIPEITEPEPDLLPDEVPTPNPDENTDPPQHVHGVLPGVGRTSTGT